MRNSKIQPDIHPDCLARNSHDILPQVMRLLELITEPGGFEANECTLAGVYATLEMIREIYRRRAKQLGISVKALDQATKIVWPKFIMEIQQGEMMDLATQAHAEA